MAKNRRIRSKRNPREIPYYRSKCTKCQRPLFMKRGKKLKCPVCDGIEIKGKQVHIPPTENKSTSVMGTVA